MLGRGMEHKTVMALMGLERGTREQQEDASEKAICY